MTAVLRVNVPRDDGRTVAVTLGRRRELATCELHGLFGGLPDPPVGAAELLLAACAVWLADRSVPRAGTPDRWTRQIAVRFPVADPDGWPADELAGLLAVLTNDRWEVEPYRRAAPIRLGPPQQQMPSDPAPGGAALFSAGLDSYAHAVNQRRAGAAQHLVGHFDMPALAALQRGTARAAAGPDGAGLLRQFRVAAGSGLAGRTAETSSRSRGLLFAAAGAAVAAAAGAPVLDVPENGYVAVNVPLTAARAGALSTRSTHPHVLDLFGGLLARLGVPVAVRNPLLYCTKGDVAAAAIAAGAEHAARTVSCGHPSSGRWRGQAKYGNCGCCYPCLVRRSGMEAALVDDPTPYRDDPRADPALLGTSRLADLRAVVAALGRRPRPADVRAVAPLPPGTDAARLHDMRLRSHAELDAAVRRGLHPAVRTSMGL